MQVDDGAGAGAGAVHRRVQERLLGRLRPPMCRRSSMTDSASGSSAPRLAPVGVTQDVVPVADADVAGAAEREPTRRRRTPRRSAICVARVGHVAAPSTARTSRSGDPKLPDLRSSAIDAEPVVTHHGHPGVLLAADEHRADAERLDHRAGGLAPRDDDPAHAERRPPCGPAHPACARAPRPSAGPSPPRPRHAAPAVPRSRRAPAHDRRAPAARRSPRPAGSPRPAWLPGRAGRKGTAHGRGPPAPASSPSNCRRGRPLGPGAVRRGGPPSPSDRRVRAIRRRGPARLPRSGRRGHRPPPPARPGRRRQSHRPRRAACPAVPGRRGAARTAAAPDRTTCSGTRPTGYGVWRPRTRTRSGSVMGVSGWWAIEDSDSSRPCTNRCPW